MASTKNTARTLKVGEIEKNPILALGTTAKDIEKYGRVAMAYGNVAPAIVGQNGKTYRILAGQARLEACVHSGIREMPVIVAEISSEAEQMKLALLLSTVREDGCPLSEGAFIDTLITQHGVTRRELMGLLKKSKSWISKRQSLALRLTEEVKGMIKDGLICARTAEEIAKMPEDLQVIFAGKVIQDGLSKTNVGHLVSLYTQEKNDSAIKEAILDTPLTVLDAYPTGSTTRRKGKRGISERIAGNAGFIIRLASETKGLIATADTKSLTVVGSHLSEMRLALTDLKTVLDRISDRVSPGKHEGGGVT